MASFRGIKFTGVNRSGFDVVDAFAKLDSARKLALFDQMNGATKTFYKTVTLLWPQARPADCKQLERFMVQRMAANDA
jgi:hypothetical protein